MGASVPDVFEDTDPLPVQVHRLSLLKNHIIGFSTRKLSTLRKPGVVEGFVKLLEECRPESMELCIQVSDILCVISHPSPSVCARLESCNVHNTINSTLVKLITTPHASASTSTQPTYQATRLKLAETLIRAIKKLYSDLTCIGPRMWGAAGILDGTLMTESTGGDAHIEMSESNPLFRAAYQNAMESLFETRHPAIDRSGPGPTTIQILLDILWQCARPETSLEWSSNRFKTADMICVLLAEIVRSGTQRELIIYHVEDKLQLPRLIESLESLISNGTGKVQESALQAFASLVKGQSFFACSIPWALIEQLLHHPSPAIRMAAGGCGVSLQKLLPIGEVSVESMCMLFMGAIASPGKSFAKALFLLAALIADNESAKILAVSHACLPKLLIILQVRSSSEQPETLIQRAREGALLILAAIVSSSETFRHQVITAGLLPHIVVALSHTDRGVTVAACHVIQGLARSTHVLRTSLMDTGAADLLLGLIEPEEAEEIRTVAAAVLSNLLLEFSPMKAVLIAGGCIEKLATILHIPSQTAHTVNILWALKNACYQSKSHFKRKMMSHIGWDCLGKMLESEDGEIAEQAFGLLRNIVCTEGGDPITGLADSELGGRMLGLVGDRLACLTSRSGTKAGSIVTQALYIVVNLATTGESTQLALVSDPLIMVHIVKYLGSSNDVVRCTAVWCIINLCYQDRLSSGRLSHEIINRLKKMGMRERLNDMIADESLDVRERVKDALQGLSVADG